MASNSEIRTTNKELTQHPCLTLLSIGNILKSTLLWMFAKLVLINLINVRPKLNLFRVAKIVSLLTESNVFFSNLKTLSVPLAALHLRILLHHLMVLCESLRGDAFTHYETRLILIHITFNYITASSLSISSCYMDRETSSSEFYYK